MTSTRHRTTHSAKRSSRPVLMYTVGFALSVLLTIASFWFSYESGTLAAVLIVLAACVQLIVQLIFFLHLGNKSTPASWKILFVLSLFIIGILVGGTLWIMHNLNRLPMMPVTNTDLYVNGQPAPQNELN